MNAGQNAHSKAEGLQKIRHFFFDCIPNILIGYFCIGFVDRIPNGYAQQQDAQGVKDYVSISHIE